MNGTCVYLMLCQRFAVVGGKKWHIHTLHTWTYSRRWLSMLAWICKAYRNLKDISSLWQKQVSGSRCLHFSKSSAHTSANTRREAIVLQTGQAQSYHTMVPSHSGVIWWLIKSLHRYWHVGWRLSNVSFVTQSKTSSIDPFKCSSHSCNTLDVVLWTPTIAQATEESTVSAMVWNPYCHGIMLCKRVKRFVLHGDKTRKEIHIRVEEKGLGMRSWNCKQEDHIETYVALNPGVRRKASKS